MRHFRLALLAAAFFASAVSAWADDKKDQDDLQGTWEVASLFADGKAEADKAKGMTLVIKADRIAVSAPKIKRNVTFKLDSTKTPKVIDAVVLDGAAKGMTLRGIYELKGGVFTWSVSQEPGGKRPSGLTPKEGDKAMILTAKRVRR